MHLFPFACVCEYSSRPSACAYVRSHVSELHLIRSVVTKLYKVCPCCTGYVIVTNAATLVRNEFRPFVACAYTSERARVYGMHLDSRESACSHASMQTQFLACVLAGG